MYKSCSLDPDAYLLYVRERRDVGVEPINSSRLVNDISIIILERVNNSVRKSMNVTDGLLVGIREIEISEREGSIVTLKFVDEVVYVERHVCGLI